MLPVARGVDERECVCSASNGLLARPAVPDTGGVTLHGVLSAERTGVLGVLGDFHLLDLLTERSTISVCLCRSEFVQNFPSISLSSPKLRPAHNRCRIRGVRKEGSLILPHTVFTYSHLISMAYTQARSSASGGI